MEKFAKQENQKEQGYRHSEKILGFSLENYANDQRESSKKHYLNICTFGIRSGFDSLTGTWMITVTNRHLPETMPTIYSSAP